VRNAFAAVLVALSSLAACERERVDVGDVDGGAGQPTIEVDAQPTIVPETDSGFDVVLVTCGPPPQIGRCQPCPTGYVTAPDGEATCECCP
jgi:hypothetical protein